MKRSLVRSLASALFLIGLPLFSPPRSLAQTFVATGSMTTERDSHTATLLQNGEVLIAGGYNGSYLYSAELYNPLTGTSSATGSLTTATSYPTATLLATEMFLLLAAITEVTSPARSCTTPRPQPSPLPGACTRRATSTRRRYCRMD